LLIFSPALSRKKQHASASICRPNGLTFSPFVHKLLPVTAFDFIAETVQPNQTFYNRY
jgi:hypothetical protein